MPLLVYRICCTQKLDKKSTDCLNLFGRQAKKSNDSIVCYSLLACALLHDVAGKNSLFLIERENLKSEKIRFESRIVGID